MSYRGKSIVVVGAGRSGVAAARFLLSQGARVILTDAKNQTELESGITPLFDIAAHSGELVLELGGHRDESLEQWDLVVVSPGIQLSHPIFDRSRKAGVPIIAEVELAYRHLKGKIIGITGSNGKTTTTTLVSELLTGAGLKGFAAGNIGTPLINFAADSTEEDIYAVELSSFQLEAIQKFRPFIASLLNLTPDHMDRYPGFEDYIAAKRRIFMNQKRTDFAVLNADDKRTAAIQSDVHGTPVLFSRLKSLVSGAFVRKDRVIFRDADGERDLFPVNAIELKASYR